MKKKSKRSRLGSLYFAGIISAIVLAYIFVPKPSGLIYCTEVYATEADGINETSQKVDYTAVAIVLDDELSSKYAYMCDTETGSVIAEKNSEVKVSPASLTKIMTAIVILDNTEDLDEKVTVSGEIYSKLYSEGAAMSGFLPGETVTMRDLLHGIMLPSGAEAAVAAAVHVAGSEEEFVEMMNAKASALGFKNTRFKNVVGFDDAGHYTNASEMAYLLLAALEYDEFVEIASKSEYYIKPTNKHPDGFTVKSSVFAKIGDKNTSDTDIICGKTGFTYDAGLCLATYGEKNGRGYIAVVMGAEGNHRTEQKQIYDTVYLYENFTD